MEDRTGAQALLDDLVGECKDSTQDALHREAWGLGATKQEGAHYTAFEVAPSMEDVWASRRRPKHNILIKYDTLSNETPMADLLEKANEDDGYRWKRFTNTSLHVGAHRYKYLNKS